MKTKPIEVKLIPFLSEQLYQKYNLGLLRFLITVYYMTVLCALIALGYGSYDYYTKKTNYENGKYKVTRYEDMDAAFRDSLHDFAEKDIQRTGENLFYASLGVSLVLLLYWVVWYLLAWIFSGFLTKKE